MPINVAIPRPIDPLPWKNACAANAIRMGRQRFVRR
jgi:hypothetical protein